MGVGVAFYGTTLPSHTTLHGRAVVCAYEAASRVVLKPVCPAAVCAFVAAPREVRKPVFMADFCAAGDSFFVCLADGWVHPPRVHTA